MTDTFVTNEARRRDRMWIPSERWSALMETIRWAEQQPTARRNVPAHRLNEERRKLIVFSAARDGRREDR